MSVDLNRLFHININVSDMNRSIAFYRSLGFKVIADFSPDADTVAGVCSAFGETPNPHRGVWMRLGDDPRQPVIDLVQWFDPPTGGSAPARLSDVGIPRIAFHVDDPKEIYAKLQRAGVEFLGPISCGTAIEDEPGKAVVFAFRDPDGLVLEVIGGVEHLVR